MAIRSVSDRRYSRRFLIMGLAICGFGLWSLYDGMVKYPHQRQRALLYEKLEAENRANDWDQEAASRGWSNEYPGEPKTEVDIKMQYAMALLCAAVGLPMLFVVFRSRGNWIESTDTGISASWGESFRFDQVLAVDKKKWAKKGIAKVTYQDGNRRRRFVIDDFKFERPTMDQILYELEQRIDPDKIVNGPPEPAPQVAPPDVAVEAIPAESDQPA